MQIVECRIEQHCFNRHHGQLSGAVTNNELTLIYCWFNTDLITLIFWMV